MIEEESKQTAQSTAAGCQPVQQVVKPRAISEDLVDRDEFYAKYSLEQLLESSSASLKKAIKAGKTTTSPGNEDGSK